MQQGPVQVTVIEYVNEFFKNYSRRAYGKTVLVNASKGAETLMGMLKLVLSRGGRDELRIALHCFKDQLTSAVNSPASVRQQHVDEVFALLASLLDAAERLRQFSPVKEQLSTAVLEEVRFRLYRIIVGDGFCEDVALRRRALDLAFTGMMREAAEQERSRVRLNKLSSTGATAAVAAAAAVNGTAAGLSAQQQQAAGAGVGRGSDGGGGKGPGRLRGSLQRKAAALSGPDFSSWEGLWNSLATMSPKRMLPLMQVVMTDLYYGRLMPGTPGAAAAAAAAAANQGINGCSSAPTPKGTNTPPKQPPQLQQQQQQEAAQGQLSDGQRSSSQGQLQQRELRQVHSHELTSRSSSGSITDAPEHAAASGLQLSASSGRESSASEVAISSGGGAALVLPCRLCRASGSGGVTAADAVSAAGAHSSGLVADSSSRPSTAGGLPPPQEDAGVSDVQEPQPAVGACVAVAAAAAAADFKQDEPTSDDAAAAAAPTSSRNVSSSSGGDAQAPEMEHVVTQQQQQQQQQPSGKLQAFGRSSARPGHPIAAGYGPTHTSSSTSSNLNSPKATSTPAEPRGGLAGLANRFSGGGGGGNKGNSPAGSGSKWGLAGGFLGLQNSGSGSGIGSGRLIPRGWVQFGSKASSAAEPLAVDADGDGDADADAEADTCAVGAAGAARGQQQQQQDQVEGAVEPPTPGKASGAALTPGGTETAQQHDNRGSAAAAAAPDSGSGFDGDEPDWGGGGSTSCCASKSAAAAAMHCTAAPAAAAGL